jgi:hypothetical protein
MVDEVSAILAVCHVGKYHNLPNGNTDCKFKKWYNLIMLPWG